MKEHLRLPQKGEEPSRWPKVENRFYPPPGKQLILFIISSSEKMHSFMQPSRLIEKDSFRQASCRKDGMSETLHLTAGSQALSLFKERLESETPPETGRQGRILLESERHRHASF